MWWLCTHTITSIISSLTQFQLTHSKHENRIIEITVTHSLYEDSILSAFCTIDIDTQHEREQCATEAHQNAYKIVHHKKYCKHS